MDTNTNQAGRQSVRDVAQRCLRQWEAEDEDSLFGPLRAMIAPEAVDDWGRVEGRAMRLRQLLHARFDEEQRIVGELIWEALTDRESYAVGYAILRTIETLATGPGGRILVQHAAPTATGQA